MKKYFLVLGLLAFLSCKKAEAVQDGFDFYFAIPQPINDAELSRIPNKFQGLFMNSDSVYLNIKENIIIEENFYRFNFPTKDIDSLKKEFIFSNGKCISKDSKEVFWYRQLKDSIEFISRRIDTFFIFSNTHKAKRFDGKLILNYKDSIYWTMNSISLEKDRLKIKYIYSEEDLKKIDSLTKVKSTMIDPSSFILKPSRTEFKRILNLKNLGVEYEYRKISK